MFTISTIVYSLQFVGLPCCEHSVCKECFKAHFTYVIKEKEVKHFTCPVCGKPDMANEEITQGIYLEIFVQLVHTPHVYYIYIYREQTYVYQGTGISCMVCILFRLNFIGTTVRDYLLGFINDILHVC